MVTGRKDFLWRSVMCSVMCSGGSVSLNVLLCLTRTSSSGCFHSNNIMPNDMLVDASEPDPE